MLWVARMPNFTSLKDTYKMQGRSATRASSVSSARVPDPSHAWGGLGRGMQLLRQGARRCRTKRCPDPAQGCSRVLSHVNVRLARVRLRSRPVSTSPGPITCLGGSWKGDAAPEAGCTPLPDPAVSRPCPGLPQGSFACQCSFGPRETPFPPRQHESRTHHMLGGVLEGGCSA